MNDAKLIDLVEAQPCIYDKTDLFYSNKEHVRSVWQMIAAEIQQEVPVCQKRWRYLRDYFVRQLHITENNTTPNDSDNKPSTAKRSFWPLYDRLSFLKPFSSTRRRLKRNSNEDITNQIVKTEDDIHSTASICSDGSDRTRASSSSATLSENYAEAVANLDYLKFYQAIQMAAQQNLNSSSSSKDYGGQLPLKFEKTPTKRKRNQSEFFPAFQQVDYAIDEHDCFFKSLLSSVRRIRDEHINAFRTEVLQIIMKYRHLSEVMESGEVMNNEDLTNEEQSGDDVVVVNTEEAHWRKNLFRKQF